MADLGLVARAGLLGVVGHAALCAAVGAVGAGAVRVATPRIVLVPVVTLAVAALLAARTGDGPAGLLVLTAVAWFAAGLAHHYLVGITPQWGSDAVRGLAHVAWDAAFHAPPLLLALAGLRASTGGAGGRGGLP